jgi:hypothetical protein
MRKTLAGALIVAIWALVCVVAIQNRVIRQQSTLIQTMEKTPACMGVPTVKPLPAPIAPVPEPRWPWTEPNNQRIWKERT